jgi:hypothetical protein
MTHASIGAATLRASPRIVGSGNTVLALQGAVLGYRGGDQEDGGAEFALGRVFDVPAVLVFSFCLSHHGDYPCICFCCTQ